jgi:hypothetical protein
LIDLETARLLHHPTLRRLTTNPIYPRFSIGLDRTRLMQEFC